MTMAVPDLSRESSPRILTNPFTVDAICALREELSGFWTFRRLCLKNPLSSSTAIPHVPEPWLYLKLVPIYCGPLTSSLDHFIRPLEHVERNCQTNLFCRLKVNDEFKLRCLLHRQISRFGAFQDLVHV